MWRWRRDLPTTELLETCSCTWPRCSASPPPPPPRASTRGKASPPSSRWSAASSPTPTSADSKLFSSLPSSISLYASLSLYINLFSPIFITHQPIQCVYVSFLFFSAAIFFWIFHHFIQFSSIQFSLQNRNPNRR